MTYQRKGVGHGGRRAGAGGKTRAATKLRIDVNAAIDAQVLPELHKLVSVLLAAAQGITMVRLTDDGRPRLLPDGEPAIFIKAPDLDVAIYLVNRAGGKPVDRQELSEVSQLSDDELIARTTRGPGGDGAAGPDPAGPGR